MRAGILIIGSLWWDATRGRPAWRDSRLDARATVPISVGIRYGRQSETRGGSFTMIFESSGPPGEALLVPFRQHVGSIDDLVVEAEALWKAEAPRSRPGAICSDWGAVGVAFRSAEAARVLQKKWSDVFRQRGATGVSILNSEGVLSLGDYQRIGGGPIDCDIILATVTLPAETPPSMDQVAAAWLNQDGGHEDYFFNNVAHGIRTSGDLEIWTKLKAGAPQWLRSPQYATGVKVLETEDGR